MDELDRDMTKIIDEIKDFSKEDPDRATAQLTNAILSQILKELAEINKKLDTESE